MSKTHEYPMGPEFQAVRTLLKALGENPQRAGLLDTPRRVVKALRELTAGYKMDPAEILSRVFEEPGVDCLASVRDIEFMSLCEHHMLPFFGTVCVSWLPNNDRVVGLSKIPRLVECFALRLQNQERMAQQIADSIETHLKVPDVSVLVDAKHMCMCGRGVKQRAGSFVVHHIRGKFKTDAAARAELLGLVHGHT